MWFFILLSLVFHLKKPIMKTPIKYVVAACFMFINTVVSVFAQSNPSKIEVLIIDGFSDHGWKATAAIVKSILKKSSLFNVSISPSPSRPEDPNWETWNHKFENYAVVIQITNNIDNK